MMHTESILDLFHFGRNSLTFLWNVVCFCLSAGAERNGKKRTLIWMSFALKTNPITFLARSHAKVTFNQIHQRLPYVFVLNIHKFWRGETYNMKHSKCNKTKQNNMLFVEVIYVNMKLLWATKEEKKNFFAWKSIGEWGKRVKRRLQSFAWWCWLQMHTSQKS